MSKRKYLIVGAGGTGGAVAGYLGKAGKDVTVIGRGVHLRAIQDRGGLTVLRPSGDFFAPVKAEDTEHYQGRPDVIFICVKEYSLKEVVPFIRRVAGRETVVIPILNIYGTGEVLQEQIPESLVTDGCIYVASEKKAPGVILMSGMILRVVFGVREKSEYRPVLEDIRKDLEDSAVTGILSDDIRRDALLKFSYVSPQGACGLYYGVSAGPMQKEGIYRDTFAELVQEIDLLAKNMGINFGEDIVKRNLAILDDLSPDMTTSLQKDIAADHPSEIDGLIYRVPDMAEKYGIALPTYTKIAETLRLRQERKNMVPDSNELA